MVVDKKSIFIVSNFLDRKWLFPFRFESHFVSRGTAHFLGLLTIFCSLSLDKWLSSSYSSSCVCFEKDTIWKVWLHQLICEQATILGEFGLVPGDRVIVGELAGLRLWFLLPFITCDSVSNFPLSLIWMITLWCCLKKISWPNF